MLYAVREDRDLSTRRHDPMLAFLYPIPSIPNQYECIRFIVIKTGGRH